MEIAKVTSKGQVTIPISIRRRLNINEGDKLLFIDRPEGVMMVNPESLPGGKIASSPVPAKKKAPAAKPKPVTQESEPLAATPAPAPAAVYEPAPIPAPAATPAAAAYEPAPETAAVYEPAPVPAPAPVDDLKKPAPQVQGLDLNALLNEIRSIGSNI